MNFDQEADKNQQGVVAAPDGRRNILLFDLQPFDRTIGKELGSLENAGKFLSEFFKEPLLKSYYCNRVA